MHIKFVDFLKHPPHGAVSATHQYPQRREVSKQTQAQARTGTTQLEHLGRVQQLLETTEEFHPLVVTFNKNLVDTNNFQETKLYKNISSYS